MFSGASRLSFYSEKIAPSLPQLREECKQADVWRFLGVAAALAGFGSFIGYYTGSFSGTLAAWLFVLFAILVVVSVYKYTQRNDRFTSDFKAAIIKKIIDHVYPGLVYKPDECITTQEYKTSSLYRYRFDYFDGDDYIEGVIGNVPFHCSELHTECDFAGNRQITIFKGMFFVATINSRFSGGTYVWPRNTPQLQLATSIMDEDYRLLPMPRVVDVHFNDPGFTEYFRVCSTWPSQANEILTAEMRSNLLNIGKAAKLPVSFSFAAGKCFIGVPFAEDLLEPTDYDPGDKEEIRKYFTSIGFITDTIKQLGLSALQ